VVSEYSDGRRLAAEFLGSAFLLAAVIGSGIMGAKLSGGNDALALLGNSLPTGAILVVLITMLAPISGAHFNPAVTGVFWLRGEINAPLAAGYVIAQLCGALAGMLAAHGMFDLPLAQAAIKVRTGAGQWFAEGVATFGLIFAILGTLHTQPKAVATAVGLYIGAAYWFTASTSFANPAVTVARAFSDTFAGIRAQDVLPFVTAQLAGAVIALGVAGWLFRARGAREAAPAE
jgi:glycerol uptake facilitator-like aquaporin